VAAAIFRSGEDYLELFDDVHSEAEDRFISIGPIGRDLGVVVWTENEDDIVRIISARRATALERKLYIEYMRLNNE
jgi:uncharacterized protein